MASRLDEFAPVDEVSAEERATLLRCLGYKPTQDRDLAVDPVTQLADQRDLTLNQSDVSSGEREFSAQRFNIDLDAQYLRAASHFFAAVGKG